MPDEACQGLTFLLIVPKREGGFDVGLRAWIDELKKFKRPIQLLLIEPGSEPDAIVDEKAAKWVAGCKDVRFERIAIEATGFGALLRKGIEAANEPLVFYTSFEFPYDPKDLALLLKRIEEKDPETGLQLHIVNGYRAFQPLPKWRGIWNRIYRGLLRFGLNIPTEPPPGWLGQSAHRFRFWMRTYFGLRLVDINSHFKIFRRSIFEHIPIQSAGDFCHGEILAKANFLGCYMDEIAIAKKVGPFPASREIPPISDATWKELRTVLRKPDFGKWAPKEPASDAAAAPIEMPGG